MKNLREMKVDDLKDIAREFSIPGIWKKTKDQLIADILKGAALNGQEDQYCDSSAEEPQNAPESTEEAEADNNEPETEEPSESNSEAPKEVKKPSLKIKDLTYDGKTQSIKEWAAELEMPWPTLYDRVNRNGWTVEEALTIPLGGRRKK